MSAAALPPPDRMERVSWRLYLAALALSFFVMVEPAPTDLVFVCALAAFGLARPRATRILNGTAVAGVLLYLMFSVFALVFVEHVFGRALLAVGIEVYMIALFAMTAYFMHTRGDDGFAHVLIALTLAGLAATVFTLVGLLDLVPNSEIFFRGEDARVRVKATFKDPNVFGPFLVPGLLFTLWAAAESPRLRGVALGALGLLLVSLVATYSRGAWAHALASIGLLGGALMVQRRTARPVLSGIVWLAVALCLVVLLFLDQLTARLSESFLAQRLSLQSYDQSRFAYIADALRQILRHPLGIGPYQARYVYGYLPHNTFVAFAMHNGIPAAIGLALIYGAAMMRCAGKVLARRPGWVKYAFVLSILSGLLVLMQVVGAIHWRHMYVVCGLAFGVYTSDRLLPGGLGRRSPPGDRARRGGAGAMAGAEPRR